MTKSAKTIIVGVSGASGVIYAQRLLDVLDQTRCEIHVVISEVAAQLFAEELGVTELTAEGLLGRNAENLTFHANSDLFSVLASGSFNADAMVVCPCSSHSLAAIGAGLGNTLLLRSAYVALKQHRRLILVHREAPLTGIDLENMLKISRSGGIIFPASPGFYAKPKSISDLVDFVVGRVLDLLGVEHELPIRWSP